MSIRKIQRTGGSFYICLPPHFFTDKMLKTRLVKIKLIEKKGGASIIMLEETGSGFRYGDKSNEPNRKNA